MNRHDGTPSPQVADFHQQKFDFDVCIHTVAEHIIIHESNRLTDGYIDLESYQSMSKRYKKALHQAHESQRQSAESQGEKTTIVEHRFNLLENLGNIVHQGDTKSIQRAIRTIFPDGVSFDGNQCRTPRLDEVLRYSLLVDNDCEAVFAGKQGEILKKSLWVEPGRVELPSKQGHIEVSTCLSRD